VNDDTRRGAKRVSINREFGIMDDSIGEYVTDISRTGVFIRTDNPLPIGTYVELKFSVVDDDLHVLEGVGKVMRVAKPENSDRPGMGLVFLDLTPESQKVLNALVEKRLKD
tara:strand:- start:381 stop:713 length:333 start_codon:yes stop_codon:yes gene_type:complete